MFYVSLVLRYLHILPAITLLGGAIFMRMGFVPAMAAIKSEEDRKLAQEKARKGWAMVVMISILLLLVSGLGNVGLTEARFDWLDGSPWRMLLLVKIVLALVVFFIASTLVGRSERAGKWREQLPLWLNINIVLAVIVVLIGGNMKAVRELDSFPKVKDKPAEVQPENN